MSRRPPAVHASWHRDRFPGFEPLAQQPHWDRVTAVVVRARTAPPGPLGFLTDTEARCAGALCTDLLALSTEKADHVVAAIDHRLCADETDGWHYDDMPVDEVAWRRSLAALDAEAARRGRPCFAACDEVERHDILDDVHGLGSAPWHGLPASRLWGLWTRYACTAFYAHPDAWAEIGFPGPAYPRGYKNLGLDSAEPFEVADADPGDDPVGRDR